MLEFVNELPANVGTRNRRSRVEVESIFAELYSNPGRWAVVEKDAPDSRMTTWKARADRLSDGGYEFAQGGDSDKRVIYGRYVGPTSPLSDI